MNLSSPRRVIFFVDGFNLYHSVCSAQDKYNISPLKWLDLHSLFENHLDLIGKDVILSQVKYYTAYAEHLHEKDPGKLQRHRAYVRALTATGIQVEVSHFKRKDAWDTYTGEQFVTHEEKETDVAIACAVLEGAVKNEFDIAVLVTGDTDLRPAVVTLQRLRPERRLIFAFPFNRKNQELAQIAPGSFVLSAESYAKHQLPERVHLPSGKHVYMPSAWGRQNREDEKSDIQKEAT